MKLHKLLPLFIFVLPLLFACKKKEAPKDINYQTLAKDAGLVSKLSDDAFNEVDRRTKTGDFGKTDFLLSADTCAVITVANGTLGLFPITFAIDFGTGSNCLGVTRKGKILAQFSGPYRTVGTVVTVTFNNYYVNDHKVEGTKTISNTGLDADSNHTFSVKDINGLITKPDGGTITWNSERNTSWVAGDSTYLYICDDIYHATGFAEGVTSEGHTYRLDIIETLEKKVCCAGLTDGVIRYNINSGQIVADLDYASATCYIPAVTIIVNGDSIVVVI